MLLRYVVRFLLYSSHYMYLGPMTTLNHYILLIYMIMMYVFHLYLTCVVYFLSLCTCFFSLFMHMFLSLNNLSIFHT